MAAETAAAPSPTAATTWTSDRIPSRSSRASRNTSLSSTSTIRTGGIGVSLFPRGLNRDEGQMPFPGFVLCVKGDLDGLDRAGGGAESEGRARIVGVEMNLEGGLVSDDDERIAQRLELNLELVAIEGIALDDEDGAVAVTRGLDR